MILVKLCVSNPVPAFTTMLSKIFYYNHPTQYFLYVFKFYKTVATIVWLWLNRTQTLFIKWGYLLCIKISFVGGVLYHTNNQDLISRLFIVKGTQPNNECMIIVRSFSILSQYFWQCFPKNVITLTPTQYFLYVFKFYKTVATIVWLWLNRTQRLFIKWGEAFFMSSRNFGFSFLFTRKNNAWGEGKSIFTLALLRRLGRDLENPLR